MRNLQLLYGYCNRLRGTRGYNECRLKMVELSADNVATGVMAEEGAEALTCKRLASYLRRGTQV